MNHNRMSLSLQSRTKHSTNKKMATPLAKNNSQAQLQQEYMKSLIANNADYFRSKLQIEQQGRPKQYRFKIPCSTGNTMYRKDYTRKRGQPRHTCGPKHNMSVDCLKTNNFVQNQSDLRVEADTTYQKDFRYRPIKTEAKKKLKNKNEVFIEDDVPRFLETHNKTEFLNWAGKNYVPSMKPPQKVAVTHMPFEAVSTYKNDFNGKEANPTLIVVREPSFPKFGNAPLMMRTNYAADFVVKTAAPNEIDCRPKHQEVALCKHFKGNTEYKREFISAKKDQSKENKLPTVEELQTLIIDL